MAGSDAAIFDSWFYIADKDRDGRIGGAEAVEFFGRSGLSKDTLFQVWNTVAGNTEALNKPQFYSAMRLVSLAQQNGGRLLEQQARLLLIGTGPVPPPPRMAGLEPPAGKEPVKQLAPQPASGAYGSPQVQQQQGYGQQGMPQGAAQGGGQFPPIAMPDLQRYHGMFAQLDTDRDGRVQGGDCYNFFLQWGLPKQSLKEVWDVVAGNQGFLTTQQFVSCLYLMDNAKRGIPVPHQLPPGQFPPVASGPGIVGMDSSGRMTFNMPEYQAQVDVTGQQINVAPLPTKQTFSAGSGAGGEEYKSRVPGFDQAGMHDLAPSERQRVTTEREALQLRDQELFNVQREAEAATRKAKFYKEALAELAVFKSRTDVALLQAQERLSAEKTEAESLEKRYGDAYAGAQKQFEEGMKIRDAVQKARETREQWAAKYAQLESDILQLSSMSDSLVDKEEAEAAELQKRVADAEARKAALETQTEGLKEHKAELEAQLEAFKEVMDKAESDAKACEHELNTFQAQVKSGSIGDGAIASLQTLLKSTASVYRTLRDYANNLQAPIPPEAVVGPWNPDGDLEFDKLALSAADNFWDDFKDEGFRVVNALPSDTRISAITTGLAATTTVSSSGAAPMEASDTTGAAPASAPIDFAAFGEGSAGSAATAVAPAAAASASTADSGGPDTSWMKF